MNKAESERDFCGNSRMCIDNNKSESSEIDISSFSSIALSLGAEKSTPQKLVSVIFKSCYLRTSHRES